MCIYFKIVLDVTSTIFFQKLRVQHFQQVTFVYLIYWWISCWICRKPRKPVTVYFTCWSHWFLRVLSSVRPFVSLSPIVWVRYFEDECTDFYAHLHKLSMGQV